MFIDIVIDIGYRSESERISSNNFCVIDCGSFDNSNKRKIGKLSKSWIMNNLMLWRYGDSNLSLIA